MQERKWVQLSVPANAISAEAFDDLASSLKSTGMSEEMDADSGRVRRFAWFPTEDDVRQQRARIAAACLLSGIQATDIELVELNDDWQTAWQKHWRAQPIGKSLWVRPPFCESSPPGRVDIVLDPGMAFGTGMHATTRLCLLAIERICTEEAPKSMLDMGAGSGLLAIAAAKLGVGHVVAVDNDPASITACRRNAAINAVQIEVRLADRPPSEIFALVVANILAQPLIDMAPKLAASTGGHLILSGLLVTQADEVRRAYEQCGLKVVEVARMDEWVAIELRRPGSGLDLAS